MAKKKKTSKKSSTKGKKTSLKDGLKDLKKRWGSATPTQAGAAAPLGDHECRINSCVIEQAKSTGRMQFNYGIEVIAGDYEGRKFHKYAGLDKQGLDYSLGDLEALELDIPDDPDDLSDTIEEAVGLECLVSVSKSDEFTNINFIELLEGGEEGEEGEEEEEEGEEEEGEEEEEESGEEEEEEEEEEGEDEITEEAINEMDLSELKGVIKDYVLDIKLKSFKGLKKKRQAIIDAVFEEE